MVFIAANKVVMPEKLLLINTPSSSFDKGSDLYVVFVGESDNLACESFAEKSLVTVALTIKSLKTSS